MNLVRQFSQIFEFPGFLFCVTGYKLKNMYYYLYRDGYRIRIGEGDEQLEEKLHRQGYELFSRPLPTREEAVAAQDLWQEQVNSRREQGLF